MPSHPRTSPAAASLRPSVFASLAAQFKTLEHPPIPLHLGDTYRQPPAEARYEHALGRLPSSCYAYSNPLGMEDLRHAFAERVGRDGLTGLTADNVHVTSGGTGAITIALQTWLEPGDEILVLAPFWPLVKGMAMNIGAVAVEVPFYDGLRRGQTVAELLQPYVTSRTVALYLTSPNNPCGTVLDRAELEAVAAFCVKHGLWALADEAYEHYAYAPNQHHFLAAMPGMATRTASVFTVSKSYALAGMRVGFLCGDPAWLDVARRVATHNVYNVPLICQLSALGAIEHGEAWIRETRDLYSEANNLVVRKLQADFRPAAGGGYIFADLAADLRGRPLMGWLSDLLRDGVSLSPGDAFGRHFGTWVRVCFTAVPPDALDLALDRMNRSLERLRQPPGPRAGAAAVPA